MQPCLDLAAGSETITVERLRSARLRNDEATTLAPRRWRAGRCPRRSSLQPDQGACRANTVTDGATVEGMDQHEVALTARDLPEGGGERRLQGESGLRSIPWLMDRADL